MDQCPKTFCYSDKILSNSSKYSAKLDKSSAYRFLNEVYERGSLNQDFNFVSGLNLMDLQAYDKFYHQNYLQNNQSKSGENK